MREKSEGEEQYVKKKEWTEKLANYLKIPNILKIPYRVSRVGYFHTLNSSKKNDK